LDGRRAKGRRQPPLRFCEGENAITEAMTNIAEAPVTGFIEPPSPSDLKLVALQDEREKFHSVVVSIVTFIAIGMFIVIVKLWR
jgi:hypothetical protein